MIIGISGSQGQGKSTVLSSLTELGYNVIPMKTSRTILNEWGLTLNDVNKYPELTLKFQERIIKDHFNIITEYSKKSEIYFVERTFADIFTYCLLALGSYNEYNDWLNEYYYQCSKNQSLLNKIFYLSGRTVDIENDGVRSVNKHFVDIVDNRIYYYLRKMEEDSNLEINEQVHLIDSSNHDERIQIIYENL